MRVLVLGMVALIVGIALGFTATRMEMADIEERFVLSSSTTGEAAEGEGGGRATFVNGSDKDFGLVPFDSEHPYSFVIRNDGDEPLKVEQVTVSCTICVVTEFTSAVVQPGDELKVDVTLTARKTGPQLHETLELKTSDPTNRHITCNLKAFIGTTARFDVEGLPLGDVSSTEGIEKTCRIYGYYDKEMELVEPEFLRDLKKEFFDFEFKQLNVEELAERDPYVQAAHELTVRIKPGIPVGPLQQVFRVTAKVKGKEDKVLELPMRGVVAGDLSFLGNPPSFNSTYNFLTFDTVKQGAGKSQLIYVIVKGPHREDVELSIGSIDPDNALTATFGEPVKGSTIVRHPLTVSVREDAPSMTRLGTAQSAPGQIVINSTHPTSKEMTLVVRFAVE